MQSSYTAQFNRSINGSPAVTSSPKDKGINRSTIRQEVKVPYSPPHHFDTIYTDQFADRKGTEEVGAMTKEGNSTQPTRKAPVGELEGNRGDIKVRMASGTSNNMTYQAYKKLPDANMRKYVNLTTGFGKFYGQTAYG